MSLPPSRAPYYYKGAPFIHPSWYRYLVVAPEQWMVRVLLPGVGARLALAE